MAQLPKGGLVRGHDKPIHGSCARWYKQVQVFYWCDLVYLAIVLVFILLASLTLVEVLRFLSCWLWKCFWWLYIWLILLFGGFQTTRETGCNTMTGRNEHIHSFDLLIMFSSVDYVLWFHRWNRPYLLGIWIFVGCSSRKVYYVTIGFPP